MPRPTPDGHRAKEAHGQRYERARRPVHTDDSAWRAADERVAALGHTSSLSYLFGDNAQQPVEKTEDKKLVKSESGSVFDLGAMFRSASEAVGLSAVEEAPEDDGEEEEVYDPEATPSAVTEDAVPYWQAFDDPPPIPEETEEQVEEEGKEDDKSIFGFSLFGAEGDYGVGGDKEESFSLAPRFADPDEARDHVLAADEPQPEFDEAGAARVKPALHDDPGIGLEALVQHGLKYGVGQRLDHLDALDDQIAGIFAEPVVEATVLTPEEIRQRHPSLVSPLAGTEFELHPTQEEKDAERAAVVAAAREAGKEPPPDPEELPADVPLKPAPERHLIHRPSKYEGLMAGLDREGGSYAAGQAAKDDGDGEVAHRSGKEEEGAENASRRASQAARANHEPRGAVAPGRVPLAASLSRRALEAIAEHKAQEIEVEESPKPPAEGKLVGAGGTGAASVFAPVSQSEGAIGFEEEKADDVVMAAAPPAEEAKPEEPKPKRKKKKKTRESAGEEKDAEEKPKRKKKSKGEKEPGEKKKKRKPKAEEASKEASKPAPELAPPAPAPALRASSSVAQETPPAGKDDADCVIM